MNKNLVYISDLIFYKKSAKEILEFLEKNKIKNLELFIEPLDEEYTKKMIEILEKYQLKSISFHGPFRKCNLADMSKDSWKKTLYSYEESLKLSKKYNPHFMVLHSNEGILSQKIDKELRNKISQKINLLVKLGNKYDIDIVIENVGIGKNMIFSQKEYENMILKNNYKCLIDVGHAYLNKWDINELVKKLKNNILGFHFHNNNGIHDEHKPIFNGKFDYFPLIELIKTYTPTANIVLEYDFNENPEILFDDYNKLKKLFD
ncbi:sugar phosphate isomerase/epimerase [Fusobacterium sp.]|uniref:sugar phosphate isomerase/epimerase family protein n=1 Tax=Fusobacterium sp. TaxID=68766 RepID=UPI002903F093|nr:sugar phosphate isomerase/epimerase [Fusobacterium sp.]MDU1910763.1 sugar phosphate isomerase/epimerase [Fusobacterium sp.]